MRTQSRLAMGMACSTATVSQIAYDAELAQMVNLPLTLETVQEMAFGRLP